MHIEGYVEGIEDGFLRGWVRDPADDDKVMSVDVFVDKKRITTLSADIYRKDLESAGIGSGKHGFEFKVPADILASDDYLVVRLHGEQQQIEPLGQYHPPDLSIPRILESGVLKNKRKLMAMKYIHGTGIEIGALHNPLPVPEDADVKYVDRMSNDDLRKHYPEMNNVSLVKIHHICDGETLECIEDDSYDFVIANHFLEHTENPFGAIENMLRVLKVGGVAYLTIPDKRRTFDQYRPSTTFEHLVTDYKEGPSGSREGHFKEWTKFIVKKETPDEVEATAKELMANNYSIHFHVWTKKDMHAMFKSMLTELGFPFVIEKKIDGWQEGIFILKKV